MIHPESGYYTASIEQAAVQGHSVEVDKVV